MSGVPAASITTSGSSVSQLAVPMESDLTSTVEKTARVFVLDFLQEGLSICKKHKMLCEKGALAGVSVCYSRHTIGNLVLGSDSKIYILTAAHMFGEEVEEYLISQGGKPLVFFKHGNPKEDEDSRDLILIPVGECNLKTQSIHYKSSITYVGKCHLHR